MSWQVTGARAAVTPHVTRERAFAVRPHASGVAAALHCSAVMNLRHVTAVCAVLACTPQQDERETGSQRQGITGGFNEADDANTLPTVHLTNVREHSWEPVVGGTGRLVTPLVLLTASHVTRLTGPKANAELGHFTLPLSQQRPPVHRKAGPLVATVADDRSQDLSVAYLDVAQLDEDPELWKAILETNIVRPSLTAPQASIADGNYTFVPTVGFAGYANPNQRRGATAQGGFRRIVTQNGAQWELTGVPHGNEGDSGGPLFAVGAGGARDVFGIQSAVDDLAPKTFFVDLTDAQTASWLQSKLVDPPSAHGAKWNQMHPPRQGYSSRWLGETDYSGPCQAQDDADCDHWVTAHDNCPGVFNPSQRDFDDDGHGDACPCPCDAAAGYADYDGDGVCAVACPEQRADNCPKVPNSGQENCNALAEQVRGAAVLGDVCDPVPCPSMSAPLQRLTGPGCSGDPQIGQSCAGRRVNDRLELTLHASWNRAGDFAGDLFDPATAVVDAQPKAVPTSARFCQSNPGLGFDCHASAAVSDLLLNAPQTLWHSITLGTDARGQVYALDYDEKSRAFTWDYLADDAYWRTNMLVPPPGAYPECTNPGVGAGTCLDGTLWFHADTALGDTVDHLGNIKVGTHGPGLSNHYVDLRPDGAYSLFFAGKGVVEKLAFPWRWKSDPGPTWVDKHVRVMVKAGGRLAAMSATGGAQSTPAGGPVGDVSAAVDAVLLQHPRGAWLALSDPSARLGGVDDRVVAVLLDETHTQVASVLVDDHGVLRTGDELGLAFFPAASAAGPTPPARSGAQAFFSKSAGGLFVAGGMTPGAALHDVWFRRFGEGWRRVDTGRYAPEQVLAATYAFADRKLWLLDGSAVSARLVRIDVESGAVQTLAMCQRGGTFTRHWLSVDADGSVLLTSSSAGMSRIARVAVDANGTASLSAVDDTEGPLGEGVIAGGGGYALLVVDPAASGATLVEKSALSFTPAERSACDSF